MILPILYLSGVSIDDYVISFIEFSNLHPLLVSVASSLLAILGAQIVIRRAEIVSTIQAVAAK